MGNIISLDETFFFQLANFLITIVVLNFLLIRPVRRQIAERAALTAGQAADIERLAAEAQARLAAHESALAEARARAFALREEMKTQGRSREQDILEAAQAEARDFLDASREEVDRQSREAMQTLLAQVDVFAARAAAKLLG
ncbi:MAG: ATP synthase F0 subunit B [Desulfovibrio sp.]|jgi:F-type H+-transporting ATPase subunit b|nr:ATP synthase F0 subunit B [Desulfovibrio sp.]